MNAASWIVYHDLLSRCAPEKRAALMHYLSNEEKVKLGELPPLAKDPFALQHFPEERLKSIHYSWMILFLEPFSENDKIAILSSLGAVQAEKLKSHFKISHSLIPLGAQPKRFLQTLLYEWLISKQQEFIPIELLPPHPLNTLLHLSKSALQHLVDFLGLHDLAFEMKKVIKSDQIKKIQNTLVKLQSDYLKNLLKSKEPVSFSRLNLDSWDGSRESLNNILHHRGFNRLAKALFGSHPSLMWHLSRRFDTGRAKILRKFFTDIGNEKAHEALINQIVELIPIIQKHYE